MFIKNIEKSLEKNNRIKIKKQYDKYKYLSTNNP